ncbi:hypothetical protein LTR28_009337 [Elasticomyces elasticus]|nr:hypothetical protein LTR28_009337 [Elasticomyces elasticus]
MTTGRLNARRSRELHTVDNRIKTTENDSNGARQELGGSHKNRQTREDEVEDRKEQEEDEEAEEKKRRTKKREV